MSSCEPKPTQPHPHWLLKRADQATVAVLVVVALVATVGWWLGQGGAGGRLIEIDRSDSLYAKFQVDINSADWPELAQLPGIGEKMAQRIVESRTADGPFTGPEDLRRVRGIGPKTLSKLRPYLRPLPEGGDVAGN